ncbi:hypothetical protein RDABS01_007831 [Bienertia sinuspersici]
MEVTTMSHAMQLHAQALKSGAQPHNQNFSKLFTFSALSPSGDLNYARLILDSLRTPNSYYWNTMLRAYWKLLTLINQSLFSLQCTWINHLVLLQSLTRALEVGRRAHRIVKEQGLDSRANVSTALIDMYSKCGCIDSARKVFDEEMISSGVLPDERTMTAVLAACRNAGLVTEAYLYFKDMKKIYGIKPNLQHHGCMVDLYARSGKLKEAEDFIRKMTIPPDAVLWRTVIWACRIHGDVDRAERLIKEMKIGFDDCDSCVLVSNFYASAGKWHDKAIWRETMNKKGLVKPPGSSKIEVDGSVHEFTAGDSSHVEAHNIYEKLEDMYERLKGEGYKPELSEVLLEVDDEEKAFQLLHHSEKLAVAFGLMKTKPEMETAPVEITGEGKDEGVKYDIQKCSCLAAPEYQLSDPVTPKVCFSNLRTSKYLSRPQPPPPRALSSASPRTFELQNTCLDLSHPPPPATVLRFHTLYREKLTYLRNLGIVDSNPKSTTVPSHKTLDQIFTIINYLKSKGFSDTDIPKLSSTCPKLFSSDLEPADIGPVFSFLTTDVAASNQESCGLILRCPSLLFSNVEYCLKPTLAFLRSIGLKKLNSPNNLNAHLLNSRVSKLEKKMEFLQTIGFTYEESAEACARLPAIFGYSIELNMMPKVEYLVGGMQRSVDELKEFPQYFAFSLTKRIVPRHLHLKQRSVHLPLKRMLWPGDEKFYAIWK